MIFGACCSPYSAQYVKNKNATQHSKQYPRAAVAIIENHYVDDYLDSFDTVEEAITVAKEVRLVHSTAGFEIRNWLSNSTKILAALGESIDNTTKNLDVDENSKGSKILGMWWSPKLDQFFFSLNLVRVDREILTGVRRPTKREVLRTLMSIYDPLGLIAFFLVFVKVLLQDIWRSAVDWDGKIIDSHYDRWLRWINLLPELENIAIPRCYISRHEPRSTEMHVFVDASETAYAAVAYFRFQYEDDVTCSLIGAKTKVAPLTLLSIPRLELQAAVLGARLGNSLMKGHTFIPERRIFWSDSTNVLSWLRSDQRRYKQFVAFRVGEIITTTKVEEWRWVPTKHNIADAATKWKDYTKISDCNEWFTGPKFLLEPEDKWPIQKLADLSITNEEIRPQLSHVEQRSFFKAVPDPKCFTSWKILVRSQAYALRFFNNARRDKPTMHGEISAGEFHNAEKELFRQAQADCYTKEIMDLKRSPLILPKDGPLHKLSPCVDDDSLLRVKGRIVAAPNVDWDTKFPVILPRDHPITRLMIAWYHLKYHHHNHETVINELRQRFAISKLRSVVKEVRSKCQICRIKAAMPVAPEMAVLPRARLSTYTRPFTFVGIDYFGPIHVLVGRHHEKRWGVLFTCMSVRAIHLEIAYSLSTDACIMALQRFAGRRGSPREIWSDNGTNFRGANNELIAELAKIDNDEIKRHFQAVDWIFNPPASPHMGGCWERLVRSTKTTLMEILPKRTPTDELLYTCLVEVENIVNSRPLTYLPIEPGQEEALTPNHFLLGSSSGTKPLGIYSSDVLISRKNWRIAQHTADLFWRRWVLEYLPTLTKRTKWFAPTQPIQIGDVVIVVGESTRNLWPKGVIIDTHPGPDGQVRKVVVKTSTGVYTRPATKIAVLQVVSDEKADFLIRGENVANGSNARPFLPRANKALIRKHNISNPIGSSAAHSGKNKKLHTSNVKT